MFYSLSNRQSWQVRNAVSALCLLFLIWILLLPAVAMSSSNKLAKAFVEFVLDGDSVELKYADGRVTRARLLGIDAPEKGQDFAQQSRNRLKYLVEEKYVQVEAFGQDQYGRDLVRIYFGEQDINLQMIQEGLAWAYFLRGQRYAFKSDYQEAQDAAEDDLEGLWLDSDYQAPWEWRKAQRDLREKRTAKEIKQEQWLIKKLKQLWSYCSSFFTGGKVSGDMSE